MQRIEIVERAAIFSWKVCAVCVFLGFHVNFLFWIYDHLRICHIHFLFSFPAGSRRDAEERIVPRSVDADDSDVDVKSDDERLVDKLVILLV